MIANWSCDTNKAAVWTAQLFISLFEVSPIVHGHRGISSHLVKAWNPPQYPAKHPLKSGRGKSHQVIISSTSSRMIGQIVLLALFPRPLRIDDAVYTWAYGATARPIINRGTLNQSYSLGCFPWTLFCLHITSGMSFSSPISQLRYIESERVQWTVTETDYDCHPSSLDDLLSLGSLFL